METEYKIIAGGILSFLPVPFMGYYMGTVVSMLFGYLFLAIYIGFLVYLKRQDDKEREERYRANRVDHNRHAYMVEEMD